MLDTKALAAATAIVVKELIAPLAERVEALAQRQPAKGDPGKDADPGLVAALVDKAVAALPVPSDGKSVTIDDALPLLAELVAKAVADIPAVEVPAPLAPDMGAIGRLIDDAVAARLADTPSLIETKVKEQVDALPKPADGKSVDPDEVASLVSKAVDAAVKALPAPKDGMGLAGALIDRAGALVVTLSDGTTCELGPVVGRDADQAKIEATIAEKVAGIPAPKDGEDGLGFDDLQVEHDGERGVVLRFSKGERVKEFGFALPVVLDRGVYKADRTYEAGDGVTWGGSYWIAQKGTSAKPDSSGDWRLAVKKGRDAKPA